MEEGMSRRRFLGAAADMLALKAKNGEAWENDLEFLPSSLSKESLDAQKRAAVESLKTSIPNLPALDYLRDHAKNLNKESQMYIPTPEELVDVIDKSFIDCPDCIVK